MKPFTLAIIVAAPLVAPVLGGTPVQVEINGFVEFDQMTITAVSSCPWDCGDVDGVVDINDFLDLPANWGPCP